MKHIGLFEGIGGFSLAARWMGWETVAWCEWNEFGQKVLKYHFPEAVGFGDITKTDFTKYANTVDIVTGGFPCQPYSVAGKRKGKDDERHLWPEMLRAIREIKPRWVVGENVHGLVNWNGGLVFEEVQADLENERYEVQPYILPACAKNAPHRRDRVWFVAYKNTNQDGRGGELREEKSNIGQFGNIGTGNNERIPAHNDEVGITTHSDLCRNNSTQRAEGGIREHEDKIKAGSGGAMQISGLSDEQFATNTNRRVIQKPERERENVEQTTRGQTTRGFNNGNAQGWSEWPTQPPICGGDDGLPERLDGISVPKWRTETLKAYGNAIVPQVALEIFKAIMAYENITP